MEYGSRETGYDEAISPGTVGVAKILSGSADERSKGLAFLVKNDVMSCSQNQY